MYTVKQGLCAIPIDLRRTNGSPSFDPELIRNLLRQLAKNGDTVRASHNQISTTTESDV